MRKMILVLCVVCFATIPRSNAQTGKIYVGIKNENGYAKKVLFLDSAMFVGSRDQILSFESSPVMQSNNKTIVALREQPEHGIVSVMVPYFFYLKDKEGYWEQLVRVYDSLPLQIEVIPSGKYKGIFFYYAKGNQSYPYERYSIEKTYEFFRQLGHTNPLWQMMPCKWTKNPQWAAPR